MFLEIFSKINFQQQRSDSLVLFVTVFYASYALGSIFFQCEIGQQISNAYEDIDDLVEEFDWHLFSHEMQRTLPIILIVTQNPIGFECFGSTSALRVTFKKVSFYQKRFILIFHDACSLRLLFALFIGN